MAAVATVSPRALAEDGQQFIDPGVLLGFIAAAERVFDAVFQMLPENLVLDPLQRRTDRLNLGQDVDAVSFILDHSGDASGLPLYAAEAGETIPVTGVIHGWKYTPWGYI
jgi:hypothetical protein